MRPAAAAAALALAATGCQTPHCDTPGSKPLRGGTATKEVAVHNGRVGFVDVNGAFYDMAAPPAPTEGGLPSPGPFAPLPEGSYAATFREDGDRLVVTIDVSGTPRSAAMSGPLGCY